MNQFRNSQCVALVVPYGELTILPGVVNTAQVLAEHGFFVHIIAIASDRFEGVPQHDFDTEKVTVTFYRPAGVALLPGFGWYFRIRQFSALVAQICKLTPYRCLFGVDADGLIAATLAGKHLRVPVFYYSLEMELADGEWRLFFESLRQRRSPVSVLLRRFLKNRLSAWFKKPLERWAHRQASVTISLDEQRARVLLKDNHRTDAKVVILPTAPPALKHVPDREYLRQKYDLSSHRKIFLQIGGISDVARSLELVKAVRNWPENWTLILHGFTSDEQYLEQIRALADGYRVILSTELVPYHVLDDLVASADLGLAFYRTIDLNYFYMASGKLLQYLKCGLPVIATDFPNLRNILDEYQCGICVSDESAIVEAAQRILDDPICWSTNAQRCFNEKFDFARNFESILAHMKTL